MQWQIQSTLRQLLFLSLHFINNGWVENAAIAQSLFGIGYIASRLTLGWKTDKSGLFTVIASLAIEAVGLLLISNSFSPWLAMAGLFMTGLGLSMVYPLLALVAFKNIPEESTGIALSMYEACFDIGILFCGLISALLVETLGYEAFFISISLCCVLAVVFSLASYKK